MNTCNRCSEYGLSFNRAYSPVQYFEGQPSSRVWIIGLNPKHETTYEDKRTEVQLLQYFEDKSRVHEYFTDFEKVTKNLYDLMGKDNGVGHTDLVKCFSPEWPPKTAKSNRDKKIIIENCIGYLRQQLFASSVEILVCNGADVCRHIQSIIPVEQDHGTYYYGNLNGHRIAVILSGFIGRIDDYAKQRLGKEIKALMMEFRIHTKEGG
jgi:uracil-DNA glycosylase